VVRSVLYFCGAVLASAALAGSVNAAEPLPAEYYGRLPAVDSPSLSPDGSIVAYFAPVKGLRCAVFKDLAQDKILSLTCPQAEEELEWLHWKSNKRVILGLFGSTSYYKFLIKTTHLVSVDVNSGASTELIKPAKGLHIGFRTGAIVSVGVAAMAEGQSQVAVDRFTEALNSGELTPEQTVYVLQDRAGALRLLKRDDEALADLNKALALNPKFAPALLNRAGFYAEQKKFTSALADADATIQNQPDWAEAYSLRGGIYLAQKSYPAALADLDKAIQLKPYLSDALIKRAAVYLQQKDLAHAQADYDTLIERDPACVNCLSARANLWMQEDDLDKAIKDLSQAVKLSPTTAHLYRALGVSYLGKGNFKAASDAFATGLSIQPAQPYVILLRHIAELRGGEADTLAAMADAGKLDQTVWPGQVASFFQNHMTAEQVRQAAATDAQHAADHQCEAAFYIGEDAIIKNKRAAAQPLLLEAETSCPVGYNERTIAHGELHRGYP
jgi:tetratricopeptide (TPR) repeat protein